jgi:signal peptidase I
MPENTQTMTVHAKPDADNGEVVVKERQVAQFRQRFRMWVTLPFLFFLLLILMGFSFNFIPSQSMEPNLMPGDNILTMRSWLAYPLGRSPARGDVVVFDLPPEQMKRAQIAMGTGGDGTEGKAKKPDILIKRIVGLPGETVQVRGSDVYVNGQKLPEDYFIEPLGENELDPLPFADVEPLTIPPGEYFLLGDNRLNSEDSRYWGTLKRSNIQGKFVRILYHKARPDKNSANAAAQEAP